MDFHLLRESGLPPTITSPTTLVVASCSAQATRNALQLGANVTAVSRVVGWVDLSSANLVDLIEDLLNGNGGGKLGGLRAARFEADPDLLPLQRGMFTVLGHDLELWLDADDTTAIDAEVSHESNLRRLPDLQ